jgi:hypothetical protein
VSYHSSGRWRSIKSGGRIVAKIEDEDEHDLSRKNENPVRLSPGGVHKFWRCPTLAQPRDALPLGLQRFTSVFGMGTGGTTAL